MRYYVQHYLNVFKNNTMKNYLILFAALSIALGLSSCKKDDDNNIEGTWNATSITNTGCDDAANDGTVDLTALTCAASPDNCQEITYVFRGDGTYTISTQVVALGFDFSVDDSGTYSYDGSTLEICDADGANCSSGSMTVDGDTATVDGGVDTDTGCASTQTLTKQ